MDIIVSNEDQFCHNVFKVLYINCAYFKFVIFPEDRPIINKIKSKYLYSEELSYTRNNYQPLMVVVQQTSTIDGCCSTTINHG